MEKEDARKQSREVLHERRKQVNRMHRKGVAVMEIVAQTGLSWTAVNTALGLYKAEGLGHRLTASQELTIQQTICDRRPE
ncbi:MAG: Winged helix-turn helix [Candidatus Nitrotoga sp. MKT]|nr:MAG: Winged helix-turn helix [Candidatus Nitrotoga sp. MKT]